MSETKEPMAFTELQPPERMRAYHFPESTLVIQNVCRICIRPSGTHRLETKDGRKWIVPTGWMAIEIDMDAWTF